MSWTSPLTALPHLSDEAVAAFADGVLSDTARQRAQSHMAGCAECSEAVYGQRAARAALRSALRPTLPAGLFERLRELPITTELPSLTVASALSADGQPMFTAFSAPITELTMVPASAPARPVAPPVSERRSADQRPVDHPVEQRRVDPPQEDQWPGPGSTRSGSTRPRQSEPLTAKAPPAAQAPRAAQRPQGLPVVHRHTSTRVGLGATAAAVLAVGVLAATGASAGGITPTSRIVQPSVTDRSGFTPPVVRAPMQMTLLSVPSSGR